MHGGEEIADLVATIHAANQELSILLRDRDCPQQLGPPGKPASIHRLHQVFGQRGIALPPSYAAFAVQHDGWHGFSGELSLLSTHDRQDPWVGEVGSVCREYLGPNGPFDRMIPLALVRVAVSRMALFDPAKVDDQGEAQVVVFGNLDEEARFDSFRSYLAAYADRLEQLIDEQKNGDP